ncbi:MAG: T9SS type A sorting domain-containing protein [Puia sp.]|nr:T9SS type A sorting domain-containing protein [Puia sp.]
MNNRRLVILFGCLLSLFGARAQSPGGIGTTSLMFWLRGDLGVTPGTTFTWTDQSGLGRNSTQATTANQPTVTSTAADYMNYNPGIKVVADQWLIMANNFNTAGNTANEIFLVYKKLAGSADGFVLGTETPGNRSYFYGSGVVQYGNSNKPTVIAPGYVTNGPNIFVGKFFSATDGYQAANGAVFSALTPATAPASFTTPVAIGAQPTNSGGYNAFGYTGNIMELVGYNTEIDATLPQRQQIESYLALKYGITLDSIGTGGQYYNSAGTPVYQGGGGSGFFTNIIGIARDDNTSLYQKQSHLATDSVRLYLGSVPLAAATNGSNTATFGANNSYIVMGDNQGNLCQTGGHTIAKPALVDQRLDREWKITYNRTADVFNMDITLGACAPFSSGTGAITALELLYSTSPDLTTGTVMANNTNGMSISLSSGGIVTISGLNSALAAIAPAVSTGTTVYFTLASNQYFVLPVQVTNFAATTAAKSVQLSWTASDETGVAHFQVLRSSDNANWQQIGLVSGAGNATDPVNYHFTDTLPLTGSNYYRLGILTPDGNSSWSKVIEAGFQQPASSSVTLFPNPAKDQVFIQYPGQVLSASNIRLYSIAGEILPVRVNGGTGMATIQLTGLAPGVYLLQVKTEDGWQVFRLLRN